MSNLGATGVTIWSSSDPASIHGFSAELEASLKPKIVFHAVNEAARDAAFAGMSSAAKGGAFGYVVSRDGHCYWNQYTNGGAGQWEWMPHQNLLINASRALPAAVTGAASPVAVIAAAPIALPPGNRLVHIEAATVAGNANAFGGAIAQPRAYVDGTNIPDGERWLQGAPVGGAYQYTLSRSWWKVCSGTVQFQLYGIGVSGPDNASFSSSTLFAMDCGPFG